MIDFDYMGLKLLSLKTVMFKAYMCFLDKGCKLSNHSERNPETESRVDCNIDSLVKQSRTGFQCTKLYYRLLGID